MTMGRRTLTSFTSSLLIGVQSCLAVSSARSCTKFADRLSISNVTVVASAHELKGTSILLPGTVESCGGPDLTANVTSNLCRLVLLVETSSTSAVQIEAWLPDKKTWNGRLLGTGNGGEGGCIDYATIQNGAELGFAAFGSNAGHNGSTGYDFFLNQSEVIEDFGHRAVHIEAEVGKEVIHQYYGVPSSKNYYAGCSTGGRQGFQNAYLYPDDFDGFLLGSPGIDWLHIVSSKGILARRVGWPDLESPEYVRPEQWPAIVDAQIKALDPLDGITDGIIDEPTKLRFDPETLLCGTGVLNTSVCLSPQQVGSVRKAYEPIADSTGRIVYPAFELGSVTDVFSANQENGTAQLSYTILQDFWRGAVYNDSTWTPINFTELDMDFAVNTNPGGVNAGETDLSQFYARGGRILSYHGRNDETVTSALSERFYSDAQSSANLTLKEMHAFYRLFFLPGMHHCSGGLGAWSIGNAQQYPWDPAFLDPTHNALSALMRWVENDQAPDTIIGTKYEDDIVGGEIIAQRSYCPYPLVSTWKRNNDSKLASSWECV